MTSEAGEGLQELYPALEPFSTFFYQADGHRVYVEQAGNPDGIPVVFLHGGPGSGCKSYHRQFFDPARYHIVIFDQRGSGRSEPYGLLEHNSTQDLIADMNGIRSHLGIDRWLLFGGSWGATLALLFAETFPQHSLGLVLRGTFLARQRDFDWFMGHGSDRIFPDYWHQFSDQFDDPGSAGHYTEQLVRRLYAEDAEVRFQAARAWNDWAGRVVTWTLDEPESVPEDVDQEKMLLQTRLEMHYATHRYFLEDNQLLRDIGKLGELPVIIIHGRRDMTCTLEASWSVHRALPHSSLEILPHSGHLAGEPAMIDALVRATRQMAESLS